MANVKTPEALHDLLATLLEGVAGNTREHWAAVIGPVEKLPTHFNVRCNWRVQPKGSKRDLHAIAQAVKLVRTEHPYVAQ